MLILLNYHYLFIGIPKTAIIVFNHGAFGGAPKRFTNLFLYLNEHHPGNYHYIINQHLSGQLNEIYGAGFSGDNVHVIDPENKLSFEKESSQPRHYADHVKDPLEIDKTASYSRKLYWYYKNLFRQKKLYSKIEKLRSRHNIKVFNGVFGGVLPLSFYMGKDSSPRAAVIFSDMDSWFTDVLSDKKKLWYRKYYSFNYALENADLVDFLSPYILNGVRQRGINIEAERASLTPCSFADYSKCRVGDKSQTEIAFASRLEPDKNPMLFLEAAKSIHRDHPRVKFHILGEGTLVHEINNFIKANDLGGVVNFSFHKNPPEILGSTRIFVSLQSGTNYPSQSVLEAMACGNAIIASNTGDTNLFVNQTNGILIDLNTSNLVKALSELIQDPARTTKLGTAAREFVLKNHTIERASKYYLELYEKAYVKVFGGNH